MRRACGGERIRPAGAPAASGRSGATAAVVLALALAGCAPREPAPPLRPAAGEALAEALGDPLAAATESWVTVYDPRRAWNGYTLALYNHNTPILLDMNGRVVRAWPEIRIRSRVRLLPDCTLLGIGADGAVRRFDWEGGTTWEFSREGTFPHHDVIALANGNTLVLMQAVGGSTDDLLEVTADGELVWEWRSAEHLAEWFGDRLGDITHVNSIQELPDNPLYRGGDARFRPGNLLISARNLDTIFVIDRASGEVTWSYGRELDLQHEARLLGDGSPGAGRLLLFNNNYSAPRPYRRSEIREIDPADGRTTWSYDEEGFWSPTAGLQQPLPNGNVLVVSSRGQRMFEITRDGRTVWQWIAPFDTVRAARYAYDYCPRLAELPRPVEVAVGPADEPRYVDPPVHAFARGHAVRDVLGRGRRVRALTVNERCQRLLLPAAPKVWVGYGLLGRELRQDGVGRLAVDFRMWLSDPDSGEELELLSDRVSVGPGLWRERRVDIEGWDLRWVRLCLAARTPDGEPANPRWSAWANPSVQSRRGFGEERTPASRPVSERELAEQRRHLKALGYVD